MDWDKFLKEVYWTNDLHNARAFDDVPIQACCEMRDGSEIIAKSIEFDKHERTILRRYIVRNRSSN